MTQEKTNRILGFITAALILVAAAALIVSCVSIYRSGDQPYSREIVAEYAARIAPVGLLCLAAVAAGIVIAALLPSSAPKVKAIRDDRDSLRKYAGSEAALDESGRAAVRREEKKRRLYRIVTAVGCAALNVYPLFYFTDPAHFSVTDLNGDVVKAVLTALIPAAVSLGLIYLCGHLENASVRRQIAVYREQKAKPVNAAVSAADPRRITAARWILAVAAIVFIILGIENDGISAVLGKAIRICTECIGLG